jgi:2,3-bisphosphoglycerate-independent phosphoglycerate mutase
VVLTTHGASLRTDGELADIAPTVLHLLGIDVPAAMTGRDLRAL